MKHKTITYLDVNIAVNDDGDGLLVYLQCADLHINETQRIASPMSQGDVEIFLTHIERISGADRIDRRKEENWQQSQGEILGKAIFSEDWQKHLRNIVEHCQQYQKGLRINISPTGVLADAIPWELLHDPSSCRYLGRSGRFVITRTPPNPTIGSARTIAPGECVRVVAVSASPLRRSSVHADAEIPEIKKILEKFVIKGAADFIEKQRITWAQFCETLEHHSPHMLHIIAHGDSEGVFFEEDNAIPYNVLFEELCDHIDIRVVILNICNSRHLLGLKGLFGTDLEVPFVGGIWAVVLNRTTISSAASRDFTIKLYQSLARHHSLSVAVGRARHRIAGSDPQSALQWSTPMLHQVYDALPFPISDHLASWINATGPSMDQIADYKQQILSFCGLVEQIQELFQSSEMPQRLQLLNIPAKSDTMQKLHHEFSTAQYDPSFVRWYNRAIRLAREAEEAIAECYRNLNTAQSIPEKKHKYKELIDQANGFSSVSYQRSKELLQSIDMLLKT